MRLALIRHPALKVSPGTCYGRRDYPLADPADIPAMLARLAGFHPAETIASPAGRCRALAEAIPASRLTFDPRLLELDFGTWEGTPWNAIPRPELDRWAADPATRAPSGGETGLALIARVTACFADLQARGTELAVVTHGGPLKILLCLAENRPIDLLTPAPPCGAVILVIRPKTV